MRSFRNSQRGGRRRRVLADELRSTSVSTHRIFRGHDGGPANRYTESALQSMHTSLVDYLPRRGFSLLVWFLAGLIPLLALVALDGQRAAWSKALGKSYLRAFDFAASGNLANWLSSIVLAAAAVVMLGIYSVRQHRRDDYRARFTVWRWAIAAAVFLSMDATAGLHHAWQGCCQYLFETPLWGDGSVWWVGTWGLVFGSLMARLMLEMRRSRHCIVWATVAACAYCASALMQIDLAPPLAEGFARTVQTVSLLLGHHCVLFTLVNYARHVVLEAMGSSETRAKPKRQGNSGARTNDENKKAPTLRAVAGANDDTQNASQPQTPESPHVSKQADRPELVVHSRDSDKEQDGSGPETAHRRLSKSERKRLRKEKRRQAA